MNLHLRPVDTFFFRNHKSMNAGEDSSAAGIFPPRPGTVYGALRSAYIHEYSDFDTFARGEDQAVKRWMGMPQEIGDFRMQGVFLQDKTGMMVVTPLDHIWVEGEHENELARRMSFYSEDASAPKHHTGVGDGKKGSVYGSFVYWEDLKASLFQVESADLSLQRGTRFLAQEAKIGIAIDHERGQAVKSMLYAMGMQRLVSDQKEELSNFLPEELPELVVSCEKECCPDFSGIHVMSMGSDQRPWWVKQMATVEERLTTEEQTRLAEAIERTHVARIVLLTPAIWESTWDQVRNQLHLGGLTLPILRAVVGRLEVIGGWDIQKRRPKPRMSALPAGSVFYVQVPEHQVREFVRKTAFQNHSDALQYEGYGLLVAGVASEFTN